MNSTGLHQEQESHPLRTAALAAVLVLFADAIANLLVGSPPYPHHDPLLHAFALLLVLLPVFHIFIYRPLRLRCAGAERTSRLLSAKLAGRGTEPSIALSSHDQGRYRDAVLSDALLALASARSIGECCEFVAGHGRGLFPGSAGGVYLYGRNGSELTLAASWNAWPGESAFMRDRDCLALTLGRISWGVCPHTEASGAVEGLCVPFAAGGTVLGVIAMAFDRRVERERRDRHRHLAARLVRGMEPVLAAIRLRSRLSSGRRVRDPVTGLFNRHGLDQAWVRELARAGRRRDTLGVIVMTVRSAVEEAGGEDEGELLCEAAYLLNLSLRAEDSVFHLAGGRFLLLMPGMMAEALHMRAEEMRHSIASLHRAAVSKSVRVRCGSALFPRDGARREELQQAAVRRLESACGDAAGD